MVTLSYSKAIVKARKEELIRAHQLNNLQLYKIAQGLLWIHEGKPWSEIGQLLGISVKALDNWLRRLMAHWLGWLQGQRYQGRGASRS